MTNNRASGILLHPTSLPGRYGIGTLGEQAKKWIDFLHKSGQKYWQILPLGHTGFGDSPYQCFSTFAGNPYLIDPDILLNKGWISKYDLPISQKDDDLVDFGDIYLTKFVFLRKVFSNFKKNENSEDFDNFCEENKSWLDDYAIFMQLKDFNNGNPWLKWDDKYRLRDKKALLEFAKKEEGGIAFYKFCQWLFFVQWNDIKQYANNSGVDIIGDIPLYVALDSADAWATPEVFQFNESRQPTHVAGVPPDYFSETGQLWGNPLYNWERLKERNFDWWVERVKASNDIYDIIRIDHFRGFEAYWSVPFEDETAMNGEWVKGPGNELFDVLKRELGNLPIIAEDLGVITEPVEKLRDDFDFPGMKILQFAFHSKDGNTYLPHNYQRNAIVYTGTHDNDTICGWYNTLEDFARDNVHTYLASDGDDIHWKMIRLAWASTAKIAIAPLQDFLGLGSKGRMNTPGIADGNWQWRFHEKDLTEDMSRVILFFTKLFDRN